MQKLTARNAQEALDMLEAALQLVRARLAFLGHGTRAADQPVQITVLIDEAEVVARAGRRFSEERPTPGQ